MLQRLTLARVAAQVSRPCKIRDLVGIVGIAHKIVVEQFPRTVDVAQHQ